MRKKNKTIAIKTAEVILEKCFESFTKNTILKISKKLDINNDAIKDAIAEIVKLNPKPGNSLIDSQSDIQQITPDFTLIDNDGILSVELNQRNSPQLRVSNDYRND